MHVHDQSGRRGHLQQVHQTVLQDKSRMHEQMRARPGMQPRQRQCAQQLVCPTNSAPSDLG
jgi:hypothetical protein